MTSTLKKLEKGVQRVSGISPSDLRNKTIGKHREQLEATGTRLNPISYSPFIGRGNVLADRIVTHRAVNDAVDLAIKE
jgi:hypothetical protein